MRLSNRTKSWAEAGMRLLGEKREVRAIGLQPDERSTLLEPATLATAFQEEAPPVETAPDPGSLLNTDPTQQLLTALGRFQRQVNLADSGASSDVWVESCIDQIINGIQIAHSRGWKGVKEALTDTARVLQSYDDAGDAPAAVAFLQDSYEILCLMVGDLIVDNVRSGVMDKWRARYVRAVAELEQAGYALIDDDTGTAPARPAAHAPAERPTNVTPFVPRAAAAETAAPVLDEEPDISYAEDFQEVEDDEEPVLDSILVQEEVEDIADSPFGEDPLAYAFDAPEDEPEERFDMMDARALDEVVFDALESPRAEEAEPVEEETRVYVPVEDEAEDMEEEVEIEEEVVAMEDDLLQAVAHATWADDEVESEAESVLSSAAVEVATLNEDDDVSMDDWLTERLEIVPESETVEQTSVAAERVETADLFFEVIEEEAAAPEVALVEPELEAPAEEALVEEEVEEEVAEVFTPADQSSEEAADLEAEVTEAEEEILDEAPVITPESLLRSTHAAMARGDVRDAKMLALQLASNMAKLEAQKAVQIVQEAVSRLVQTEEAIALADSDVARAESRLSEMQSLRGGREHDLDVKRAGIGGLEKRAESVEAIIIRLQEQIAQLTAQLESEQDKLSEVQSELEAERDEEGILLEDLDRLHEAEQGASDTLELAKARVAELHAQRLEREQAREACEQMLARQRESAENIEQTLEAVLGKQ